MRAGSSLEVLKDRGSVLCAAIVTITALAIAAPAQAGRGISIDTNTVEIWSDASDADTIALPFPVNYGSGLQSNVTVHLPQDFGITNNGLSFAAVGLSFTGSPSDVLFGTINGSNDASPPQVPGLRLATATEGSNPYLPLTTASSFDFGNVINADMPPPSDTGLCQMISTTAYCYGPMVDSVMFQFTDLSSSGNPGDFELVLTCGELCGNIGFNLAGQNFSADDFNPNAPLPPNLVSYSLGDQNDPFHPGTWDFVFRSTAILPEPSTWASMLVGFGLLGGALRRQRKLRLQAS